MKRIFSLALLVSSAFAFSGCKYTLIEDGKVPAGYESYAHAAEGIYVGTVANSTFGGTFSTNMQPLSLTVAYANERITLSPSVDFLGEKCGSKIGPLLSVETSGKKLNTAVFAFNGGTCAAEDRIVVRMFDQSSGKPKLVVFVMTGSDQVSGQSGGSKTVTYQTQADVRKQ